ncbi:Rod shape-determining protein MreD [Paraliobacillus sp. PM-2]|uniref:rod shape-determining protein MreD n=1 Tax=Paraliobacillus sp. PM-2 TaxID=1462524 RepID=UPI00061C04D2|nr:rod shape-determining protein MreD [Paraliobacillus sp. PM-2]CQR48006.1 Rod shape-determining protein MreD [Paraliobacillus sp. PM-2]
MSRIYIPLLLLFLFVMEGIAYDFIPSAMLDKGWLFIAHWAFIFIVLMALFYDLEYTYYSILAAVIIGLMTDVIYTDIIGVYMFAYGLVVYLIHGMRKVLHANFFVTLLLVILGVTLVDGGISFVYYFIGINNMLISDYLLQRLLPTLVLNVIVFCILYLIFKNRLSKWSVQRFDTKSS